MKGQSREFARLRSNTVYALLLIGIFLGSRKLVLTVLTRARNSAATPATAQAAEELDSPVRRTGAPTPGASREPTPRIAPLVPVPAELSDIARAQMEDPRVTLVEMAGSRAVRDKVDAAFQGCADQKPPGEYAMVKFEARTSTRKNEVDLDGLRFVGVERGTNLSSEFRACLVSKLPRQLVTTSDATKQLPPFEGRVAFFYEFGQPPRGEK